MLAGISIAASEARKKTTRHESSRWMFILKKGIFFHIVVVSLSVRQTPHTLTWLPSFHLHGDDKSHYKMEMNGVLI